MATETTESFTTCVGEAGKAIGLPQLCGDWFANQIFWLAVAMVAIYFILSRMALPRISAVLAERAGAISRDIAAAEELKKKALDAEAAYDKALADARVAAAKIVAGAKADIQAGLDAELKKADVQIGKKTAESEKAIADIRAGAVKSVAEVAKDTAAALVAALGGSADTKTVNAAVTAWMKG